MRKQVDFAVHVATLNAGGINGGMTSATFTRLVKESFGHFGNGWEVIGPVQFIQNTADGISILATFVKYEDDGVALPSETVEEVRRGPGRARKEEVAPA